MEQISLELNKKKNVTGAFLDVSNAFDFLNHKILLWRFETIDFDTQSAI